MDAREYLEQIEKNECIIANKQIEKKKWLDIATGTTAKVGGERVQTSGDGHTMEKQIVEVVLIDEEIERLKGQIAEIIATLERLRMSEYDFLHKLYVQHLSMKDIQAASGKSYSWATTTHNRALMNLQKILDGQEKARA